MTDFGRTGIEAVYSAVESHARTLGIFDGGVDDHEPWNAPSGGLACAILLGPITPIRAGGLAATSGRLELQIRVYSPRLQQPSGGTDKTVLAAVCLLMAAYSGDFELAAVPDDLVRMIDLLGAYGAPLSAQPGWLEQDGQRYRVHEITLPLILNDMWGQVA